MVICRFFAGFWGSSVLATSPSIIGDVSAPPSLRSRLEAILTCLLQLFNPSDRGNAMNPYMVAAFAGPVVGPVAGSFLASEAGYQWLFWLLTIFGAVSFVIGTTAPPAHCVAPKSTDDISNLQELWSRRRLRPSSSSAGPPS